MRASSRDAIRVREADERDLPHLASIEGDSFSEAWDEASLRPWLETERGLALVVDAGPGTAAGYALFLLAPDEAELLRIAVRPGLRRTGLAGRLLLEGLERLRRSGRAVVTLEVRADNRAARALYERFRFLEVGTRRGYYADGCDAVVYRREAPVGRRDKRLRSPSGGPPEAG
jgi:ribosomal-protein-alanine N-acetyltransferase